MIHLESSITIIVDQAFTGRASEAREVVFEAGAQLPAVNPFR